MENCFSNVLICIEIWLITLITKNVLYLFECFVLHLQFCKWNMTNNLQQIEVETGYLLSMKSNALWGWYN